MLPLEYLFGIFAPERFNHNSNITQRVNNVKRYLCLYDERKSKRGKSKRGKSKRGRS